ncbi:MAG TPA: TetR/AcrR family transcriptional regulator [Caldilineaceae bacterium]|nr:TetR/AcrR family transcriptional regulator [Caldilineaceae bacterium]
MSRKPDSQRDDLRIKRTQLALQQTFMELVVEVGFSAITVQMLTERAMINRSTFYRHYADIYDLVEKVYDNLMDEYLESVQSFMPGKPVETLQYTFEHCATYGTFYLALLSGMPRFQILVRDTIEQQSAELFKSIGLDEDRMTMPLPIILRHWSTTQMAITQWWLENGQPIPAVEMARYLWELYESGAVQQLRLPMHHEER